MLDRKAKMNEEEKKALAAEVAKATQESARGMIKGEVAQAIIAPEAVEAMARAVADKIPAAPKLADKAAEQRSELNESLRKMAETRQGEIRANIIGSTLPAATTLTGHGEELVPTTTTNAVVEPRDWNGLVDRFAYNFQMPTQSVRIPTVDAVTANINAEGDVLGYQGLTTGMINLRAYTLNAIVPMTKEFVRNAQVDVYAMLGRLARQAFAKLRDQIVLGTMTGQSSSTAYAPMGILTNASVTRSQLAATKTAYTDLKLENLITAYGAMDADSEPIFVAHRSVLANMAIEKNTAGNYMWDWNAYFAGRLPFGMRFEESKLLPSMATASQAGTDFAMLADFSDVIHGWNQEMTVEISDQAVLTNDAASNRTVQLNAFQDELVFFKVVSREGFALYKPADNFIVFKTAAS